MAESYTQADRPLTVSTPLGKDALLLLTFEAEEGISRLFRFHLELTAVNERDIPFDRLLGQPIVVKLDMHAGKKRYFGGICRRVTQAHRDPIFTHYEMEVVPQLWLLTKRSDCRTFQHMTVPDILKKVMAGLDVHWDIKGTFQPRDYTVQYRETDFNFVSRLMEEEGLFYFFTHSERGHRLVVANTPQSHPDLPEENALIFEHAVLGGKRPEDRVLEWRKSQELRSGRCTLRDHSFQLPHVYLEASQAIQSSVRVGTVEHRLSAANESLELYDFPGEYAWRVDDVGRGGMDTGKRLDLLYQDNQRTVDVRMEQEAVPGLVIEAGSNCRQIASGHKFTLREHFNANDAYVVVSAVHKARLPSSEYRAGGDEKFHYSNKFTCMPLALPYRPPRVTPKPFVPGTHTALVVGLQQDEIYTDRYGRIKVQFHWDREGKHDGDTSRWIRVNQAWAGKMWGLVNIPRVGQEVLIGYEEGDIDRPVCLGNVFNAYQMPAYELPANQTRSWIKTSSTPGGDGYNGIFFEDKVGKEQMYLHAERNMDTRIEKDSFTNVGGNVHRIIGGGHSRQQGSGSGGGSESPTATPDAPEDSPNDDKDGKDKKKDPKKDPGGSGPQGPAGAEGPQGPQGPAGPPGAGGGGSPPGGGGGGGGGGGFDAQGLAQDLGGKLFEKVLDSVFRNVGNDVQQKFGRDETRWTQGETDIVHEKDFRQKDESNSNLVVQQNYNIDVKQDANLNVDQGRKTKIGMKDEISIGDESIVEIEKSSYTNVGQDYYLIIDGEKRERVKGKVSLKIEDEFHAYVLKNISLEAKEEIHLKSKKIVLEADKELGLKVGGNFITIKSDGVYIKGSKVYINSGGKALDGKDCDPDDPSHVKPTEPEQAAEAKKQEPEPSQEAHNEKPGFTSNPPQGPGQMRSAGFVNGARKALEGGTKI